MDFKMHTCLQSIIASKSHSEVPWVSLSHMGTPKLNVFLEEKNISLEKSAENVHGWLELQHGLRTDAELLLCPWPSAHQSYQHLYEGDLQTTLSLK